MSVTTFAKPNFAPGGKKSGGNKLSTVNKISDREINIASAVNRRNSITCNFNQDFVQHASNHFACIFNRAASHTNFIGTISRNHADCPAIYFDNIFSVARLNRKSFVRRQVKFADNHTVNRVRTSIPNPCPFRGYCLWSGQRVGRLAVPLKWHRQLSRKVLDW